MVILYGIEKLKGSVIVTELIELHTKDDLQKVWDVSTEKPVLLFKQSTTCPVSAAAFDQFKQFIEASADDIAFYFVKVRETREVSNQIEEETKIKHESPQIFFIKNKEVLWNTSHLRIKVSSIEEAVKAHK